MDFDVGTHMTSHMGPHIKIHLYHIVVLVICYLLQYYGSSTVWHIQVVFCRE